MSTLSAQQQEVIATFQKSYDKTVLKALAESEGNSLPDMIAQTTIANNMEQGIFYSIDASDTSSTLDFTDTNDPSTAGSINSFTATINPIYSKRRVYMNELNKTNLDLGSSFIKSFVRGTGRAVNIEFLGVITAAKIGFELGDPLVAIEDQLKVVISRAKLAAIRTSASMDRSRPPLLVMNHIDYAVLFDKAQVANKDFDRHNLDGMFYGCKVVTFGKDTLVSGTSFIIPADTVGNARWDDNGSSANYSDLFDGRPNS